LQAVPDTKTVDAILQWRKAKMLTANPEYQRGEVWTLPQKKRLVDSVMRGYPIPLIYLHHIKTEVAGAKREDFEVIDGQQRINALYEYKEGAFKLFDPKADAEEARFPSFIEQQPCPWGGKAFDDIDSSLQKQFLDTMLSVVMIHTDVAERGTGPLYTPSGWDAVEFAREAGRLAGQLHRVRSKWAGNR
jgi:hypothetical protein